MESRGRVSSSALATVQVSGIVRRAEPPETLTGEQAEVWREIVATKPPDWFEADTVPLLEAYCKGVTEYRKQSRVLDRLDPAVEMKDYSALCKLVKDQAALLKTLATAMRLTPQSRYTPKAAATANKNTAPSKPWEVRAPRM